jgi:sugar lactone lactonase YvrE
MSIETIAVSKPFLDVSCALGEAPFVEEASGTLRFVDIIRRELHVVSLSDASSHVVVPLSDSIGYVSPPPRPLPPPANTASVTADIHNRHDAIIVAAKRGFALYHRASGELEYLKTPYEDPALQERMRFNDGAVDSRGRFWAGSMNESAPRHHPRPPSDRR